VLLGAGGMLHRAWDALLNQRNVARRNFRRSDLDLARPETIDAALPTDCKLLINCAAFTDVDAAEDNEQLATTINGLAVGAVANACRRRGAFRVHYSTDYVFDGNGARPYLPDAPRNPLGAYGRSKAVGEQLLEQSGCSHLLIRTSWLYAPWGKNFVRTIASFARQNKPLKIVHDQRGRPTSSEHLAAATLKLLEHDAQGTHHLTDGGHCTWYEFAKEIARRINPSCPVTPITTAQLGRPAQRPAYSVLDLTKTESLLDPMPPWQQNLADVLSRLEA
jgi:dTDP-4-dehydrorhamnose reductase